jgi:glycosyltransferase involved in cell wall biosynthesis
VPNEDGRLATATDLTFVIPVHNEEENLLPLHQEITRSITRLNCAAEIIYVDDGSTDRSFAVLRELRQQDSRVRIIKLRANFGQTPALAAGFDSARGAFVVTLDADLQNDPADVPKLLAELRNGYDVVSGWRKDRKEPWLSRRLPSKIANLIIAWLTGLQLHDSGCTLKVYKRGVVKNLPLYADAHRFLPAIASIRGARVSEVPVSHRPRTRGRSKYGIGRTTRVLFDLLKVRVLVRFSSRPLHWFGLGSIPFFMLGSLAMLVNVITVLDAPEPKKINVVYSTTSLLFFALALHFLLMGLLGELAVKASRSGRHTVLDSILAEVHE